MRDECIRSESTIPAFGLSGKKIQKSRLTVRQNNIPKGTDTNKASKMGSLRNQASPFLNDNFGKTRKL